ncbi:hypothetical protein AB0J81_14555 [Streptomyces bobili]|uniref:hypothetical protein n=1 Tax=Streptomyces bobili TaxID=67280 RepID=UPI0034375578
MAPITSASATMIAACGVVSAILMVDAMAVGPEFGPLASATPRTGSFVVAVLARAAVKSGALAGTCTC